MDMVITLDLNIVNTIFVVLGIILNGNPQRFLAAVPNAIKTTGGIMCLMGASGIGQWAVQTPTMLGDARSNMIYLSGRY